MRRPWLVIVPILAVATVLTGLASMVLFRTAHRAGALHDYLAAHFVARHSCPAPDPFVETDVSYDCYDGTLPSGRRVSLIVGGVSGSRANLWSFVGIFVPGAADRAIAPFATRVRARGDWWGRRQGGEPKTHLLSPPPDAEPVRAETFPDGALVVWRLQTQPTAELVAARLAEVDAVTAAP